MAGAEGWSASQGESPVPAGTDQSIQLSDREQQEPRTNLFGIHEKYHEKLLKGHKKIKRQQYGLTSRYPFPHQHPEPLLHHSEIKHCQRRRDRTKAQKTVFSSNLAEIVYWFQKCPLWHSQTKTEGKTHIPCTLRSDMVPLLYLRRGLILLHMQNTHLKQKRKIQKEKPSRHRIKNKN